MRSVASASPTHCAMLAYELDTEIPTKPRRSISRARSSVARRWPGSAIRLRAGRSDKRLHRRPERFGDRAVGRVDGDRLAFLPLGEDHRHADAPAFVVELDRAGER